MEIQKLQQSTATVTTANPAKASLAASKSPLEKVVAESERLAKDYKREVAKNGKLQLALSTLQIQHDKLTLEVDRFNKSASGSVPVRPFLLASAASGGRPEQLHSSEGRRSELEVKVEQLQAEVEKKTTMLMEVKRHLKEAAEREKELKDISSDAQVKKDQPTGVAI